MLIRNAVRTITLAVLVAVTAFGLASATSASAAATTSISGTVRQGPFGFPFQNITVMVLKPTPQGGQLVGTALSDANGQYTVTGLAASGPAGYFVCYTPGPTNAFISTCFANAATFTPFPNGSGAHYNVPPGSAPVVVSTGHPETHIDGFIYASLDPFTQYGTVSGTVTDLLGTPLSFVKVWAIAENGSRVDVAVTSKKGTYTLGHAPISPFGPSTVPYAICFDGSSAHGGLTLGAFGKRCYKNAPWGSADNPPPATATAVPVTANSTVSNINVKLPATL